MAERLKDKGLNDELAPFRRRILRQAAHGRISKGDCDHLTKLVDEIEAYVIRMPEAPEKERSFL